MVVGIFMIILGGFGVFAGISAARRSSVTREWPVVKGRVVERGIGPNTTSRGGGTGRLFEPRVKYTYSVSGHAYTGSRIGLAAQAYDEATAKRTADKIPDEVDVHYDPANPADAVLDASSIGLAILMLLFGAGAFIGGAITVLSSLRSSP